MNDTENWQTQNDNYLAASLEWLRLRLLRLASSNAPELASESEPKGRLYFRRKHKTVPRPRRVTDEQLASAEKARLDAEQMSPPPALLILARHLGAKLGQSLSRFEQNILLLCAAMELDPRVASLCAAAQGDTSKPFPTFALAMSLFEDPAWDVLTPDRPLRFWRLIEINQPGAQSLTASPLRADERIVNYLKGLNYIDDRLTPLLTRVANPADTPLLSPSQEAGAQSILEHFHRQSSQPISLIQLVGVDPMSKREVALRVALELKLTPFRLRSDLLAQHDSELETLTRLWQRDSRLLPIGLYLDAHETNSTESNDRESRSVRQFLERMSGLVLLSTRDTWTGLDPNRIVCEVDKPTPSEQQAHWSKLLGAHYDTPALLAGQFSLNLTTIQQIAALHLNRSAESDPNDPQAKTTKHPNHDSIWIECLSRLRPKLDSLAQRIDAKATFDHLVVPDVQRELLWSIVGQARHRTVVYDGWGFRKMMNRGLGISALFAGASGTGKTMAAEVIANELQLNLYRIDLSAVVNKYIGETEKNLRRLFDAAEEGGAVLFFDEADALFGKRSEVKDSHDRYANIEVNYLLQRMESYAGLAILATNMKSALDDAFMRRLRFVVEFSFPGVEDRKKIWRKAFPRPMPQVDYEFLARLNLTGGNIHNIALNSAFLAAQQGLDEVTMPLVLKAARTELLKLERHINEADFQWKEPKREVAVA